MVLYLILHHFFEHEFHKSCFIDLGLDLYPICEVCVWTSRSREHLATPSSLMTITMNLHVVKLQNITAYNVPDLFFFGTSFGINCWRMLASFGCRFRHPKPRSIPNKFQNWTERVPKGSQNAQAGTKRVPKGTRRKPKKDSKLTPKSTKMVQGAEGHPKE